MLNPNFTILYVADPARSVQFYTQLLGYPPVEASANFALFVTPSGNKLGLWARHAVEPSAFPAGGSELVFAAEEETAVDSLHRQWWDQGIAIAQPPRRMEFGRTFTALDPDGHRLRVYHPDFA